MAHRAELSVAPRTVVGKATKRLRREGFIPANIYGHKQDSIAVQIEAQAFEHLRREHGTRSILTLRLPNAAPETALVRHIQRDARNDEILHIDFARVSLRERLAVKVPLHFVGEAPGVKVEGGVLLPVLETLDIECEAADIVDFIEVDISGLTDIDSTIRAGEIKLPANYTLVTDTEEPVIKVAAPRVEEAETVNETAETAAPAAETPAESGE